MHKAKIDNELRSSIIAHNVFFDNGFNSRKDLYNFRKNNLKTTQMFWITLSPVIDEYNFVYNPKALIFKILN